MKPLPMPLRIAAGLVATAIEEAQELPRRLIELPITAVSQCLQATMRMQQRVTELAIKGDRALGALRPVPETPAWARFDEDEEGLTFGGGSAGPITDDWPVVPPPPPVRRVVSAIPITRDLDHDRHDHDRHDHDRHDAGPTDRGPGDDHHDDPGPDGAPAVFDDDRDEPPVAHPPARWDNPPAGLEGYDSWTLPQLRGRFRALSPAQVRALLAWETSHQDRPPYVTMLSNRLASITGR